MNSKSLEVANIFADVASNRTYEDEQQSYFKFLLETVAVSKVSSIIKVGKKLKSVSNSMQNKLKSWFKKLLSKIVQLVNFLNGTFTIKIFDDYSQFMKSQVRHYFAAETTRNDFTEINAKKQKKRKNAKKSKTKNALLYDNKQFLLT